jgi:hypothetical protein
VLTAHEIFGFMSPALAREIVDSIHTAQKDLYRATRQSVAEAKKVRPIFLERKPRAEQHADIVAALTKSNLDFVALNVLQTWLLKCQAALLGDFLDALGIKHEGGAVDDLPATMDDAKLRTAVENLLTRHPHEKVAVYLRAFNDLNQAKWPLLAELLDKDARLQLGT